MLSTLFSSQIQNTEVQPATRKKINSIPGQPRTHIQVRMGKISKQASRKGTIWAAIKTRNLNFQSKH